MDCLPSQPPTTIPFDAFVARPLIRMAGPHAPAVRSVYEQWAASPREGQTFLDYLTDRGVIDRVGARGVLHAWQGIGMDTTF